MPHAMANFGPAVPQDHKTSHQLGGSDEIDCSGLLINAIVKTGSFDRDIAGTALVVAYTGVGFKPSAMIFTYCNNGQAQAGIVVSGDPISNPSPQGINYSTAWWTSGIIEIYVGGGRQYGTVQSFDADGFTISWNKTGSPTGTMKIQWIAFR